MVKKICFFTTTFSVHAQYRAQYARKYLPKDVQIFLATPFSQNKYSFEGIKLIELSENKLLLLKELRKLCKEREIDLLINLGTSMESWWMLFATFGTKTKYIVQIVGNDWDSPKLEKSLTKKLILQTKNLLYSIPFSFSKRVIFAAKDIQERARERLFFMKNKLNYIDLIIDEKLFSPKSKTFCRKKLRLPLNKKIIIFVARVEYLKGSDIIYSLIKNNPDKLFLLIGTIKDPIFLDSSLQNMLLLNPLPPEKLAYYYNASDLSILPSRIEGYGLVSREAMLCGIPSIVSNIPSLKMIKYAIKAKLSFEDMQNKLDSFFSMTKVEKSKLSNLSRSSIISETSYENLKDKYKSLILG